MREPEKRRDGKIERGKYDEGEIEERGGGREAGKRNERDERREEEKEGKEERRRGRKGEKRRDKKG